MDWKCSSSGLDIPHTFWRFFYTVIFSYQDGISRMKRKGIIPFVWKWRRRKYEQLIRINLAVISTTVQEPKIKRMFLMYPQSLSRSQWLRDLRRSSVATRMLRLWVRSQLGAWVFVCCECCVWSGSGLLRQADHSLRGVLRILLRRCVWSRNLVNENAQPLFFGGGGAAAHKTNTIAELRAKS
jgi:hypothetical protein